MSKDGNGRPVQIVWGQRIEESKQAAAKTMRSQMTPAEAALWQRLRGNKVMGCHFRRQQVIAGFIVDFYCHSMALAVEVDGDIHDRQPDYDRERGTILTAIGISILRFTNTQVFEDISSVLNTICRCIEEKTAES